MTGEEYIAANRALDRDLERLTREKAALAAALRSPQQEDFVDASIRQFSATANARLLACSDFQLLAGPEALASHQICKPLAERRVVLQVGEVFGDHSKLLKNPSLYATYSQVPTIIAFMTL
jgi:hypothetical protein